MLKRAKHGIGDNQNTFGLIWLIIFAVFQLNFVGCVIPIPKIPEKAPFADDSISLIKTGSSTKETVKEILGEPNATRQNDSVYVYANPQQIGWVLPISLSGNTPDAVDWNRNHLLIIQFTNDGIVKEINHIVGTGSQRKDGIYVADPGLRPKGHSLFGIDPVHPPFDRLLILYAPRDMDERAKQYLVPPNKSAIYLFRQNYHWFLAQGQSFNAYDVSIDSAQLGDFGEEGYYCWIFDPGVHYIRVSARPPNQNDEEAYLSIDCREGIAYFVELTWPHKGFLPPKFFGKLTEVDKDKGQSEIGKRRLILDRFNPFE